MAEGRRALILVVERDPHVRALERYFLEEAGFTVDFALDGRAAPSRGLTLERVVYRSATATTTRRTKA